MIFGHNRNNLRQFFYDTWQKHQKNLPKTDLEKQVLEIILEHPEYQEIIDNKAAIDKEWFPELSETNPFLHLSLHLSIREQLSTDSPKGIRVIVRNILKKFKDPHKVEHKIMRCLVETMEQSIDMKNPEMSDYLKCLRRIE